MRTTARILTVAFAAALVLGLPVSPSRAGHNLETSGGTALHYPAFSWGQQITIVDRTQPWPVSNATSNWNTAFHPGLVHYHWWNCSHGVNCAQVNEITSKSAGYLGAAFIFFNTSTGHILSSSYINRTTTTSGRPVSKRTWCRRPTVEDTQHVKR